MHAVHGSIRIQPHIRALSRHPTLSLACLLATPSTCHSHPFVEISKPPSLFQTARGINFTLKGFALVLCPLICQVPSYKLYHLSLTTTCLMSRAETVPPHCTDLERLRDLHEILLLGRAGCAHGCPDVTAIAAVLWQEHPRELTVAWPVPATASLGPGPPRGAELSLTSLRLAVTDPFVS